MPYRRVGKTIEKQESNGTWHVKSHCESVDAAKHQLRLLNAIEHGWRPAQRK